jgi:hypothetical protein
MLQQERDFFHLSLQFFQQQLHTTLHRDTVITPEQQLGCNFHSAQMWRRKSVALAESFVYDWLCNEDDYFSSEQFLDFFIFLYKCYNVCLLAVFIGFMSNQNRK